MKALKNGVVVDVADPTPEQIIAAQEVRPTRTPSALEVLQQLSAEEVEALITPALSIERKSEVLIRK